MSSFVPYYHQLPPPPSAALPPGAGLSDLANAAAALPSPGPADLRVWSWQYNPNLIGQDGLTPQIVT